MAILHCDDVSGDDFWLDPDPAIAGRAWIVRPLRPVVEDRDRNSWTIHRGNIRDDGWRLWRRWARPQRGALPCRPVNVP